ncbi:MAG: tRNA pseudouridine synthase A [Candidatus Latescibacteria bacterium]|nr:tRNA pseudouridine synthase A [Candidatus Latescibacterota bacterium]
MECAKLYRGLNGLIGEDVVIRKVADADSAFHARFSATARHYRYRITNRPVALGRNQVWYVPSGLDVEAMTSDAETLVETNDLASFCERREAVDRNTTVNMYVSEISEREGEIQLDLIANRFLINLVRSVVGTLVAVGRGNRPKDSMRDIIALRDCRAAGQSAPAHGLCLIQVFYDEQFTIPVR